MEMRKQLVLRPKHIETRQAFTLPRTTVIADIVLSLLFGTLSGNLPAVLPVYTASGQFWLSDEERR